MDYQACSCISLSRASFALTIINYHNDYDTDHGNSYSNDNDNDSLLGLNSLAWAASQFGSGRYPATTS